ncbi:two-component system, NarL family, sensor histidine kinase DegS [Caldanaerovirga acetigignens]|uniref:Oxygen sensor histidine kinase NreB n=1 Tax=Caldanaerovirga acetigignens TaxID=447595 RepID=A0A1M7ISD5_9FIRM|nr:sensor histidine kinase [Caldanaerovirga acetigignens]SHM43640.1 two-component system, NarL family, sensor histidine kinase DegS [Caldanaerovirga acetigignens]
MKRVHLDAKHLENVIRNTIEAVEKGHEETFKIAEHAKKECERLEKDLEQIKKNIAETIKTVEKLEKMEKNSKYQLMVVSRDFENYSEEDIKAAYERSREIQIMLTLEREREKQLREKRDEMERNLKNMQDILKKAERVTLQMGVALNFLKGNLQDLSEKLTDINQKQLFAGKIIKAQEEERKAIAREIHDGPAQSMANLLVHLEVLEKIYEDDPDAVKRELKDLKKIAKNTLAEIRKIIFNLRPSALDDLGIEAVARRYCSEFQEETGISVDFVVLGERVKLDSNVEITLFRVIQEALSNVKKHAMARNVRVKLEFLSEAVNLGVEDDGVGFDIEKLDEKEGDHFGITNIKERVDLLSGTVRIRSEVGCGTNIFISIPLR